MNRVFAASFLAFATALSHPAAAANWPHWRGPDYNGSSPEKNLPTTFSKSDNVAWTAPMPGPAASTPVIFGDVVFISSTDQPTRSLAALCLDRKTGEVRWRKKISEGFARDERSNYASPSPVTDGKLVVFFYGNGELAAFDFNGKEIWHRNVQEEFGEFAFQWTFASSPLLHDGRLYLQILQRDAPVHGRGQRGAESFLVSLNPATGETQWRVVRPTEARAESREAFTSPIPVEYEGRREILVAGGDLISGHDAATGRERWRWGTWNPRRIGHWRLVPSPVSGGGVVLACAPKKEPVFAVKLGLNGTLTDEQAIAWQSPEREITTDVPTPLFYQGDFFVLSDVSKNLTRVAPDGKVRWTMETPGFKKFESSPTGADGKIYLMNFGGDVLVVGADDGRILHTAEMGEPGDDFTRSTISVSRGQLFIRTNAKLYCVGK